MKIRNASAADAPALWRFLAVAAHEETIEATQAMAPVARYLEGWPRPGDFGVLALGPDDEPSGAAWARQFRPEEEPFVYIDDRTPEIAVGVLPESRGQGIGRALLGALISRARSRTAGLCLNVRDDNPSLKLYARLGFEIVPGVELINRTGGRSVGMALRF